ncbi:histidine phosphatase family protein [uncultured Cellulomonas sp.]|uniref:SixA phosphatase family protein n=1 Tax=uncultured Cellulomonas sp. TaxID=189682 RepID=UPI0026374935|nr:histidine phosphatase family protein [uncultured Cellulomonas sp.]
MSPISDRTRRLVLLRHAKAEPGDGAADEVRPLALDGRRQAGRVGTALRATDLVPEVVLVSPAVRTRQTWELLRGAFGDAEPEVVLTDALYTAGVDDVVRVLREVDERVRTVLVVGHEPTMSATAAALAGAASDATAVARVRAGVPTATYVVLELDDHWQALAAGAVDLRAVISPDL